MINTMETTRASSLFLSLALLIAAGFAVSLTGCSRSDRGGISGDAPVTKDLAWCSEHGDLAGVKGFLNESNINGADDQTPPLHLAAKGGQIGVADFLISQGAEINKPDTRLAGWTPVHYAASSGQTEMIAFLVEKGAKIDIVDEKGEYPIHTAAFYGHLNAMKKLIDAGSKPDQKSGLKTIRNYGLAPDRTERTDCQPIHVAARGNQPEVIRFLIGLGVTPDTKDANGSSPLDYALLPMGWTPSRAATIRLLDKDTAFEKAATNIISTDGYYVTEESPPKYIRFMPEELVDDGENPYYISKAVISFGPRGGEEPENVAKWLHPNNREAHKQGVFFECTYKLMMDHVSMQTFYSDYGGGVIRITKNRDGKFRLLMRNQQQEFFSESHKNTKTEFSCKFVSWKLDQ